MFFDECEKEYKLVAQDIDELIEYLNQDLFSTVASTPELEKAMEPLFEITASLAPRKDCYDEVKELWIRVPRGEERDDDYDYPDEIYWYKLVLIKGYKNDGSLFFYDMMLNAQFVINATIDGRVDRTLKQSEGAAAIKVCELILPAVEESMNLLKEGKYNEMVQSQLPYRHRAGVVRRSDIWAADPEKKKEALGGLSQEDIDTFKKGISNGKNCEEEVGRIEDFTANTFLNACKLGYEAVGKNCKGYTLSELYRRYSDGRDEGLTGLYRAYEDDNGIDLDDPQAWNDWYFGRKHKGSGHPWEVYPGVCLYVSEDRGYYFEVSAGNRPFESVKFYNAIVDAGYPVVIYGGDELVASFEGTDYVGIVPCMENPSYCEEIIPEEYGEVIDFEYVDQENTCWFDKIIWLPEKPAEYRICRDNE